MTDRGRLVDDLAAFAAAELRTGDLAPAHVMLPALIDELDLDVDRGLWLVALWLAYYSIPSAVAAFDRDLTLPPAELSILPIGNDRRSHRSTPALFRNLRSWLALRAGFGDLDALLRRGFIGEPETDWRALIDSALLVDGNGRWAAYTLAETLHQGLGWPVSAPDLGHAFSSGPRRGLALFFGFVSGNGPRAVATLDGQSEELRSELADRGVDVDRDSLESLLCDFSAMARGRYYPGKDIANLSLHVTRAEERGADPGRMKMVRAVMARVFPPELLLDDAPDRERVAVYRDTGRISWAG